MTPLLSSSIMVEPVVAVSLGGISAIMEALPVVAALSPAPVGTAATILPAPGRPLFTDPALLFIAMSSQFKTPVAASIRPKRKTLASAPVVVVPEAKDTPSI